MSKFTWRIENFSRLDAKYLYSLTFLVDQKKWRVLLYPKGNNTDHLSLYLDVPDSSTLPAGWSVPATFSLSLVNQIDCNKTITKEFEHTFNSKEKGWGSTKFIPLCKFHGKSGGFLVEDICFIEAEVYVSPVSSDKDSGASLSISTLDSVYMEAQSLLESLHKAPTTGVSNATYEMPVFEGHSTFAKEIFDKLMPCHLDDLADPKHETAVMGSLCKLTNHLDLLSDAQAKEIANLKATLRDSVQVKDTRVHPWSTLEKTRCLLEDLVKTEEGIQTKMKDLESKEKELEAQLEVIKSSRRQLQEEREEVCKQTKIVCCLAKDQASNVESKEAEIDGANKMLEQRLKSMCAATRHLFP